jgi:Fungal Zn(2)-Cys(6) binuclear cluster domain
MQDVAKMTQPLQPATEIKRTRAHKPKVRTGCVTCKIRRVKCDETKPLCLKCTKSGRKCDGYVPLKTWVFEVKTRDESSSSPSLISSPPSDYSDPVESRSLQYFRERTAPVLSSFATVAQEFFNSTLLQAGQVEPAVKHMIIATALLQEAILCTPGQYNTNRWYFGQHYSKAIALLTGQGSNPSVETVLMSCLLFLTCENFQGSSMAGLLHIYSGLKILKDWKASRRQKTIAAGSADDLIQNQIDPIFARLEAQTSVYRSAYNTNHPFYSESPARLQNIPSVPTFFKNLFLARDSLDEVAQWMFHILDMEIYAAPDSSTVLQIRALLDDWHLAFKTYTASLGDHSRLELRTASALEIHYQILSIKLEVSSAKTESIYDSYLSDFTALVQQCEDIIKYRDSAPARNWAEYDDRMSLFEFDFGMIAPLFMIASHCRDPTLRRKAIRLMRYLHRTEGAWDTCSAGKIAESIMEIEERGLTVIQSCHSITENSRIRATNADIDPIHPSRVILSFCHSPYEVIEQELISWVSWSRGELESRTFWVSFFRATNAR